MATVSEVVGSTVTYKAKCFSEVLWRSIVHNFMHYGRNVVAVELQECPTEANLRCRQN